MLVFSVLLAGCVDESGGSSEYSSNAQSQNVYVPQHYKNLLKDSVRSISAGECGYFEIYLDSDDKNNYVVYGTIVETAEGTSGVRFYIEGPDGTTYADTGEKVRSYSFNFHPTEAGYYRFYLDNTNTLLANKLPKLTIYEEYDQ